MCFVYVARGQGDRENKQCADILFEYHNNIMVIKGND